MSARGIARSALLCALLAMAGCAGLVGVSIPDKGRYVDAAAGQVAPVVADPENLRLRLVLSRGEGILQEPAVDDYVNGVAHKLLAGWPVPGVSIPVYVVPCEEFTAEGAESNAVFLTTGVLQYMADNPRVATEDHLAFVLAHELSHVLLGHARDRAHMQNVMHRVNAGLGFAANLMRHVKTVAIAEDATRAAMALLLSVEIADGAVFPGLSREQENQADVLAIDLMWKAGYSLDAVTQVMDVLKAAERAAAERQSRNHVQFVKVLPNGVSFQTGPLLAEMWADLGVTHPDAVSRDTYTSGYIRREYDDQAVKFHRAEMDAFLHRGSVRDMLGDSRIVLQAYGDILAGQPGQAGARMSRLRSRAVINSPIALTINIVTANDRQQDTRRDAIVSRALSQPYATKPLFTFRARQLESTGQLEQALQVYQTAYQRFDATDLLPNQVLLLRKLHRNNEATIIAAKCYATGQTALQEACSQASKT